MSRTPAKPRSPLRLLLLGAVLLWVVSPLLLGGLITVAVRAHNGAGIGFGLGILLALWTLVALLALLAGFAALVAAVVAWWRERSTSSTVHAEREESYEDDELAERDEYDAER